MGGAGMVVLTKSGAFGDAIAIGRALLDRKRRTQIASPAWALQALAGTDRPGESLPLRMTRKMGPLQRRVSDLGASP